MFQPHPFLQNILVFMIWKLSNHCLIEFYNHLKLWFVAFNSTKPYHGCNQSMFWPHTFFQNILVFMIWKLSNRCFHKIPIETKIKRKISWYMCNNNIELFHTHPHIHEHKYIVIQTHSTVCLILLLLSYYEKKFNKYIKLPTCPQQWEVKWMSRKKILVYKNSNQYIQM